jgi:hypothetical protein
MLQVRAETIRDHTITSQLDRRDKVISIADVQYALKIDNKLELSKVRIQKIAHELGYRYNQMRPLQQYVNKDVNVKKRA